MKLNELLTLRPIAIHLSGGDLNLSYNPRAIRMRKEDAALQTPADVAALFCEVVKEWDLLRDDGSAWPLQPDLLFDHALPDGSTQQGLPQEILKAIMDRIGEEVQAPLAQRTS